MGTKIIIPNYELLEQIGESPQAIVYKAYHKKDPTRLLALKVLKDIFLSDTKKSQFQQKIEQLKVLNDPLLITPLSFESRDELCFITQYYYDGVPLDNFIKTYGEISIKNFFIIACGLARALDKVHEAGIIHGGVKPHNILVNPDTLDIRLIDFISSFDVREVSHFIYHPSFIQETLSYTSPEQTGRINHRVDFSSDMYSLGILFYRLLTGRLPFSSNDPLEVIHSHLAEEAPEVHKLISSVPLVLSNIVAKLMLKEPEKRYQSSNGLLADLIRCRDDYNNTGTISEFPLDNTFYTHRVTFISKMVGRDAESKAILDEYEHVAQGHFCSMLISGLSGIGKTRLIQELQKPIVKHRGYFTSGKFDVYQKNIPYSSLIQALRNLMRTFLTESDERVSAWKSKILKSFESSGKVLTDVIPELEVIIGPQPAIKELPPVEALNRFHDVFDRFLACLATKDNPLVLFIDDLQWCDIASFDFFTNIFINYRDHPYLFFLGAYRYNEVDSSHPLMKLIRNARENGFPLKEIRLGPLKPEYCHEMVSYILDSPLHQTKALADFISNLSEGNPLFVSESLSFLHNEDLLYLDTKRQWRWDMEKIRLSTMPKTVVALFASKIQSLPLDSINLLEYCACMGNTFSPTELSSIKEFDLSETFRILKPALGLGLLMEHKNQLQFIHDKVQEAALSAITQERRREIHWHIGTHLQASIPKDAKEIERIDNLFAIVAHLNLGREKTLTPNIAYFLSDLNFHAGKKALDSLATEAANEYYKLSRELLPDDLWADQQYERTFKIFQQSAKTELMCGNYDDSERILNQLLGYSKTDLDKAECLAEQTTSLSSIGNFIKAIETANRGLFYFGKAIPDNSDEADKKRTELMSEITSRNIDIWNTIRNMPFTTDRKSKVELKFYSELIPDLYMSGMVPQLYLSAAQSTALCLAGGMDESVIYSFSIMGLQLGEQEDFEQAFKYEDLARDLSAKYPNTFGATRGMNGIVWCNAHSRSHPKDIVEYCLKSIQCGKNCGDLYNAGLSYGPLMWNLQVLGADLSTIGDFAKECLQFSNRYHLSFSVGLAEAMQAGWIAPMKKDYIPEPITEKLRQWEQDNHVASSGSYYVHSALAHYYFGEYEKAQEFLDGVRRYLTGLTDNVLKRQWYIFLVLNALKLHERKMRFPTKEKLISEIKPLIKKVETWAGLGPLLKPYLAFLYAELERVTGEFRKARSLYLDAIDIAHQHRYTFLEGHLNACLGELLHQAGSCSEGIYFVEALRLYKKCHAERMELDLMEHYPRYFETLPPSLSKFTPATGLPEIDVAYLMKSALAISAEVEQDALLKRIMNVVLECSGAQNGYLLIEDKGNLFIRAGCEISEKEAPRLLNQNLEDAGTICKAIVRYVYRTGARVILDDANREGMFKENPEVQDMKLRSVLCLPVIKQSKLVGILYLENKLSNAVFTPEKIQMTELLTSQAAISLENAHLINDMKKTEGKLVDSLQREHFLADLIRNASVAVAVGYPDGRLGKSNNAFQKLTGYSEEEMQTINWNIILTPPEWRETDSIKLAELNKTRMPVQYEKEFVQKNGTRIAVEMVVHPYFDNAGNIVSYYAFITNIADRKQAEKDIKRLNESLVQRAAELESSNKELEAFSYSVSHDLRAPLRHMDGFSKLVLEGYADKLDEKGKQYLSFIRSSSDLMGQLITAILNLSRITRAEISLEKVNLSDLAHHVVTELMQIQPDRKVDWKIAPGVEALGDKYLLKLVFDNLLGNAFKFTSKSPKAEIEFGEIKFNGVPEYFVRDNGVGFDMKYVNNLFKPFHRLHKVQDFPGTGVGLASVHRIVTRLGGKIRVEAELNKGATFYFTLHHVEEG